MQLVDSKGLAALRRLGLHDAAIALAKVAQESGAVDAESTFRFLEKDEKSDGLFIARISIGVERVNHDGQ